MLIRLERLRGEALVEEMCHCGVSFDVPKVHARLHLPLPAEQDLVLHYFSNTLPATMLPALMAIDEASETVNRTQIKNLLF